MALDKKVLVFLNGTDVSGHFRDCVCAILGQTYSNFDFHINLTDKSVMSSDSQLPDYPIGVHVGDWSNNLLQLLHQSEYQFVLITDPSCILDCKFLEKTLEGLGDQEVSFSTSNYFRGRRPAYQNYKFLEIQILRAVSGKSQIRRIYDEPSVISSDLKLCNTLINANFLSGILESSEFGTEMPENHPAFFIKCLAQASNYWVSQEYLAQVIEATEGDYEHEFTVERVDGFFEELSQVLDFFQGSPNYARVEAKALKIGLGYLFNMGYESRLYAAKKLVEQFRVSKFAPDSLRENQAIFYYFIQNYPIFFLDYLIYDQDLAIFKRISPYIKRLDANSFTFNNKIYHKNPESIAKGKNLTIPIIKFPTSNRSSGSGGGDQDFISVRSSIESTDFQGDLKFKPGQIRSRRGKKSQIPKVSILVPTYNQENYLHQALNSLIFQTLSDIEIICINDGSKDRSLEILQQYASRDSRIKIIDKPNSGYGNSMNIGIEQATGEYIGILEPDDYVDLEMFAKLYSFANHFELDFVKCDFYIFAHAKNVVSYQYNTVARIAENYNVIIDPSKTPTGMSNLMHTWCGIYKREFLNSNDIRYHETPGAGFQDNSLFFQTSTLAKRALFFNEPLYYLRRDNPNSSVNNKGNMLIMDKEMDWCEAKIREHPALWEIFKYEFTKKSYFNKIFNLQRLGPDLKEEYAEILSKWCRDQLALGLLAKGYFTPQAWSDLLLFASSPKLYLDGAINRSDNPAKITETIAGIKSRPSYLFKLGLDVAHRVWRKGTRKFSRK